MKRTRFAINAVLMTLLASLLAVATVGTSTTSADEAAVDGWSQVDLVEGDEFDPGSDLRLASGTGCTSFRWVRRCAIAGYAAHRDCGKAWCGLVGTLGTSGPRRAYRADLYSSSKPGGYRKARWMRASTNTRDDKCKWGVKRSRKAGYILSKYGPIDGPNNEAAAVDLAVTHFLCGRRKAWRIGGSATDRRLNAASLSSSRKKVIRDRAREIVREANRQYGPYRVRVTGTDVEAGQTATVTVRITTKAGRAAPNRRVILRFPDGSTRDARTSSNGVAQWAFEMPTGTHTFRVRAVGLEQHRLLRQSPKLRHGSRILVAGRTYAVAKSVTITTKARPSLAVTGRNAKIPAAFDGSMSYTDSIGSADRQVSVELLGPWSNASRASCDGPRYYTQARTFNLSANGTYDINTTGWAAPKRGNRYYMWRVSVAEDAQNAPVRACSAAIRMAKATPATPRAASLPSDGRQFNFGDEIRPARFEYDAGWGSGRRDVTVRLWGPFPNKSSATCSATNVMIARERTDRLTSNGRHQLPVLGDPDRRWTIRASTGAGWYRFQVIVRSNDANERTTLCGYKFRVTE